MLVFSADGESRFPLPVVDCGLAMLVLSGGGNTQLSQWYQNYQRTKLPPVARGFVPKNQGSHAQGKAGYAIAGRVADTPSCAI